MCEQPYERPNAESQSIPSSVDPEAPPNRAGSPLEGLDALAKADPLARLEAARNRSDEPSSGYESGSPGSRLSEIEKQARIVREELEQTDFLLVDDILTTINEGLTPVQALDYLAIEQLGYTKSEWARQRGVRRQSVQQNMKTAKEVLNGQQSESN